jgi:hypothetical protein
LSFLAAAEIAFTVFYFDLRVLSPIDRERAAKIVLPPVRRTYRLLPLCGLITALAANARTGREE